MGAKDAARTVRPMARARDQDACPGALQLHRADDGALARVRLPGGMVTPRQLEALAHAATRFGSPAMELTSRGNIQIRGIDDDEAAAGIAEAVADAGLLPSPTHERVRNIVATPLSGRLGGSEMARCEKGMEGSIPLSTLRCKVEYGFSEAATPQGNIGIKVWVNQGDYLTGDIADATDAQAGQVQKKSARRRTR